jgi:small conductance mechanosensitive channel
MEQIIPTLQQWTIFYGVRILAALAILVIGRIVAGAIKKVLARAMERSRVDTTLISFVTNVTYVALMAFVVIAAVGKLGVQTASFVAVIGAAGLAIGLALQGSLANFAAGVLMIIFRPFRVGDYIEGGGMAGTVEEISIFTTHMKSPDNRSIIVPNAKITSDSIVNYSAKEIRRVDLVAGVSYSDDIDKVKSVLWDIINSDERVLKDPAPTIALFELADSSVDFVVRPWVKSGDYWNFYFEIYEKIKKRFDAEGIGIPFPQQDVHLYNKQQ